MALESTSTTWEEALLDFHYHLKAARAVKTVRFYEVQLRQLVKWTDAEGVAYGAFGKRHLDRYLAERAQTVFHTTHCHDAVYAKAFFRWCAGNDLFLLVRCGNSTIKMTVSGAWRTL